MFILVYRGTANYSYQDWAKILTNINYEINVAISSKKSALFKYSI